MSGVLIDGRWSQTSAEPSSTPPAKRRDRVRQRPGEIVQFPSLAHPSFGYPDFALSANRRRSARRRQRRRVIAGGLAGGLLLATVGTVVANEIGTHRALSSARSALTHTRHQLSTTTSQRDNYESQLHQAQDQLSQAQQSLSSAQNQLDLQTNQITELRTCLNGVLSSLSYAASNDYTDAIATINRVSGVCTSASSLLGPPTGAPAPTSVNQPPTTTA
jgi:Tfp pilus assembly protein FimV